MTHFGGRQLTSRAFCTLHETPAKKNSPLGTRQGTMITKKALKLWSQRIAEAVADVKNLSALTWENADTAHSCGHVS